jgi:small subunit ribosomal protein S20
MANSKQAAKRAEMAAAQNLINRTKRSRMRNVVKAAETAIASGEKAAIGTNFKDAMSALHRAASKGLIRKETAARKISRLAARIRAQKA